MRNGVVNEHRASNDAWYHYDSMNRITLSQGGLTNGGIVANPNKAQVLAVGGDVTLAGNSATKTGAAGWGTSAASSQEGLSGNAYLSVSAGQTNPSGMSGLNADPATDNNYTSLDYAWSLSGSTLYIYENGSYPVPVTRPGWAYSMAAAAQCSAPSTQCYQRRRPERTLWYRIVQTHLKTWLELASEPSGESPPTYVERTFRRYLECGILAHGFARAWRDECQHDFLIAYSCKGRGVCPSCAAPGQRARTVIGGPADSHHHGTLGMAGELLLPGLGRLALVHPLVLVRRGRDGGATARWRGHTG